ncbi:MAG: BREX system P-loop protein BrxC [Muribaculaceae bacterium]|nr:BREX system P-loop protein BrxC [Muribaculaceae bacterium]
MAKIKDILSIKLEDDIKSVINLNSQGENDILEELNAFILTESLAKHLSDFCDFYGSSTKQAGLWLSGFYGSGKSYFAKMIGMLLNNRAIVGTPMRERFVPKLNGLSNAEILKNSIDSLGRTPNHVVLFDSAKETGEHGISYMMMAAFLRSLGFLDNWIGFWEYDIYINGQYDEFVKLVQSQCGEPWVDVRKSMQKVIPAFKKAVKALDVDDDNYSETKKLIETHINTYDANKLGADLQRYLDKFADTRVVFLVDEVSEAITQDKINLLDLEAVAETLADTGRRVWTIAIAQQKLDDVITSANVSKDKLTKLIDRFKERIDIKADEVETIIRHRLLDKTEGGEQQLMTYFDQNSGKIGDITNIGASQLHKTVSAQTYSDYYPFFGHQFKMLQYFLFGTQNMVKTQVGTRGMLISAFDILKKEAVKEQDIYVHVNASQLCRQAESNVSESLNNRYNQAEGLVCAPEYSYVNGRDLLQTIHFLTQAEVIQTTAENISKSYVSAPDDYYNVKAEVNKALEVLVENHILLYTANQYRITSEIEQRIINDLNSFEVPAYRIKSEAVKEIKNLAIKKAAEHCNVDGLTVDFSVKMNNDEALSTSQSSPLNIVFHDIFSAQSNPKVYINAVQNETQSQKDVISLVPDTSHTNDIWKLIDSLVRMNDLEYNKSYSTAEEKAVVQSILNTRDEKKTQLAQLMHEAYNNGTLIYCYNTSSLDDSNYKHTIDAAQRQMFGNIYTRRLSSTLSDALAPKVLNAHDNQLRSLFTHDDFKFFDTAGHFIGDHLNVVTELMDAMKNYAVGADLEKTFSAPPTGFTFGTIITTLAVLFRANKIIVKHGGQEYHSYSDAAVKVVFNNTSQFKKASFKAVSKSLTYNERQDIVDILKDDCHFNKWTGEKVTYKMNDYELVDAIRSLSREVLSCINHEIMGDEDMERKFSVSVGARDILVQYTAAVTDLNYYSTAKQFLNEQNNDEYVKAVTRVAKDLDFIKNGLPKIREEYEFIKAVDDELEKSGSVHDTFEPLKQNFEKMYEANIVANAAAMAEITQKVKDHYYQLMKHQAEEMTNGYTGLQAKIDELKSQLDAYPHDWNKQLYNKIDALQALCKRNIVSQIVLNGYNTKCAKCNMQLRDMVYQSGQLSAYLTNLAVWETEIVKSDPTPQPTPQLSPGNPQPQPQPKPQSVVRSMKQKMPSGKLTVEEYRQWLKKQLAMVNGFGANDSLDFDN